MINILNKHITSEDRILHYYKESIDTLTYEQRYTMVKNENYEIEDVKEQCLLTKDEQSIYYLDDIIYNSIILKKNGELLNIEELKAAITEIYPFYFDITPNIVNDCIKKGFKYIFNSNGSEAIPKEQRISTNAKYEISEDVGFDGLCSEGGFLDFDDTLFKCVIFDNDGKEVELSHLQKAFLNRWKKN